MLAKLQPWQKTLLDAAEIIKRDGHWKASDDCGAPKSQCIISATMAAAPDHATYETACANLCVALGSNSGAVMDWNDAPERTADEVIAALQSAALKRMAAERGQTIYVLKEYHARFDTEAAPRFDEAVAVIEADGNITVSPNARVEI